MLSIKGPDKGVMVARLFSSMSTMEYAVSGQRGISYLIFILLTLENVDTFDATVPVIQTI